MKSNIKFICIWVSVGTVVICAILAIMLLNQPVDKVCLKMLEDSGWHVRERSDSGMGYGAFSGEEFLLGTVGDITFTAYVTEVQGIAISNDDNLYGYEYVLEETCIERPFHAYFLVRDGEVICSAVWYAEVVDGLGATSHRPEDYYPVDTPIGQLRREAIWDMQGKEKTG